MMTNTLHLPVLNRQQDWGQLYGASLALAIAEHCKNSAHLTLIVTPDNLSAYRLTEEIAFFTSQLEPALEVLHFPDWETLPYDQFSPHQDIISERLATLSRLTQLSRGIVLCSTPTLLHKICPPSFIHGHSFCITQGQTLNVERFRQDLSHANYRHVNKVIEHGEYSIRGSLIDLFPMGSNTPFRLDLFDEEIDSIRQFCPDTQRSIKKVDQVELLPAREFPFNDTNISQFRRAFRELVRGNPSHCPIYESVSDGIIPAGIEYYMPLFFNEMASFFDYLPLEAEICLVEDCVEAGAQFWQELKMRHQQLNYDITRPILSPDKCFIRIEDWMQQAKQHQLIHCYHRPVKAQAPRINAKTHKAPKLPIDRKASSPLKALKNYLDTTTLRVLFVAESAGRREVLLDLLQGINYQPEKFDSWDAFLRSECPLGITLGPLSYGVELLDSQVSIVVESQLFGESVVTQKSRQKDIDSSVIIKSLAELRTGSPVVHIEHGVGRYLGLQHLDAGQSRNEFLVLEYAGGDKIYVPVTSLHMISRYSGGDIEKAPLNRLGSDKWQTAKKKAMEKIHDVAIELLDIYAKRQAKKGFQYQFDKQAYQQFSSGFPFDETIDQRLAIQHICQDMQAEKPMDRLICGDVGFGKTEVAMRAAFIAVQNSKQVCILVPTTLLAGQHFENFGDRFADFPIRIELLSRFRTNKESEAVLDQLAKGQVDIVIGTHKLIQQGIQFKNLGLLIIDEEHRFGVKQKEHIKAQRNHVDILSMTATPIPRTLNMAMSGIRDISLIATPPAKRLAVKTFWQQSNPALIREALLREILRGGQVYFLHNNVQTIDKIAHELNELVPEAKVIVAHGQMRERQLEKIMSDFYHHRYNVLVCTTIIETGIDVPTANTILIDRADKFGLAQLHQLRGRVGRSHHQAYAYLLTPESKAMTKDAVKRLEAIVSLEDLGAGFTLATHDLEIRGAGEFLGEDQSGQMHAIGFTLYMELLDRAVSDLKSGKKPELEKPFHHGTEIDLKISTIIPEDYIGDIHTRLITYKRIANAESKEALQDMHIELIDRFGLLPDSVKQLLRVTELKLQAQALGIIKIKASSQSGKIEFDENPKIKPENLIKLIQIQAKRYQLDGPNKLKFSLDAQGPEQKINEVMELICKLRD